MKHDIRSMKLIFDVQGKPDLAEAIKNRLVELGVPHEPGSTVWREWTKNVSLNWGVFPINFGFAEVTHSMWKDYRLTTLDDLYSLDAWVEPATPTPELPDKPSELLRLALADLFKSQMRDIAAWLARIGH